MLCCSRAKTSTDFLRVGESTWSNRSRSTISACFLGRCFAVDLIYRVDCFFCFLQWRDIFVSSLGLHHRYRLVYAAQLANWRWPQMTLNKTLCSMWLPPSDVTANGATFCHRMCFFPLLHRPPFSPSSTQPLIALPSSLPQHRFPHPLLLFSFFWVFFIVKPPKWRVWLQKGVLLVSGNKP